MLGKRPAEQPIEPEIESKKPCIKETAPIEDDFSEISDDADEILDRVEEATEHVPEEPIKEEVPKVEETEISQPEQKPESPKPPPLRKEESLDEENPMELDFEEISEDELEEETRVKGLGDALGVDWASLVAESRPRIKPLSSAKRRWESHNVLVNLGVSVEMAGEDLVKDIMKEHAIAIAQEDKETNEKATDDALTPKEEIKEELINGIDQVNEKKTGDDKVDVNIEIPHPIACIQVAKKETLAVRKSLFSSAGPYRRALSARRDLAIRRHLCNLPIKDTYVEAPKQHNPELFQLATQLFQRCL